MTATGTSERPKKQHYMFVIWSCLLKFKYSTNDARYSRWDICVRQTVIHMNGIQVSCYISSRMGETSNATPTTTFPWLSPV